MENNQPPNCSFSITSFCTQTGEKKFTFKNTSSDDTGIASGKIDFGDGTPIYQYFGANEEVERTYAANSGQRTISVEVTDNQGLTTNCAQQIDTTCDGSEPICILKREKMEVVNKKAYFSITAQNTGADYTAMIDYGDSSIEYITNHVNSGTTFTHDYSLNPGTTFNVEAVITNNGNGKAGSCTQVVDFRAEPCNLNNYVCVSNVDQCTTQYYGIIEPGKQCATPGLFCCLKGVAPEKQVISVSLELSKKEYKIGEDKGVEPIIVFKRNENTARTQNVSYLIEISSHGKVPVYRKTGYTNFNEGEVEIRVGEKNCGEERCKLPEPHLLEFENGQITEDAYRASVVVTSVYADEKVLSDNTDTKNFLVYRVRTAEATEMHWILIVLISLIVVGIIAKTTRKVNN